MNVLIVEDDGAARALLVAAARDRRHDVHAFGDAESVWAFLAAAGGPFGFDLAIVDIGLPGQDGIDFCRLFKSHPGGRHALILLVTADERAETLEAALDAGADDYVIKPVDRRRLCVRLAIAEQRWLADAASRQSQDALRASESRFEAFMDNSPALAFIKDAQGRFVYVSQRYLEVFDVAECDVVGRTVHKVFGTPTADPLVDNDHAVLRDGPRQLIETVPLADGPHHWLVCKFPLHDSTGRPTLVGGIAMDITDRLMAEEALRVEKARAEALLRVATLVNSQQELPSVLQGIAGRTKEALRVDLVAVMIREQDQDVMRLAAMEGGTDDIRRLISRIPFDRASVRGSFETIRDLAQVHEPAMAGLAACGLRSAAFVRMLHGEEYIGALAIATEAPREFTPDDLALLQGVTDQAELAIRNQQLLDQRRRQDEQMRNAQKLESLGVLAGGIAHDFNNLLVGVLGNAGLALLELPEDSPAREPIRDIETSAQRAAELTRQMLAYSGRGRFQVEPVDVSAVVEEMSQLLRRVISKQAQLSLRLGHDLPAVVADVTQVRHVVMNLITNASDALADGSGTIALETGTVEASAGMLSSTYLNEKLPAGRYVYLEVSDTGSGMDQATAARIFEPFYTTKFTGRGLGLAAVLGIVRGHRGALDVRSAPDEGTTFRVLLPASASAARPAAASEQLALPRGSGLVLLVDDEDAVRGLARRVLERGGFEVVEAASGEDALARLANGGPAVDAVVLDLTMPGLGGEATLREIRRTNTTLPVVVSSGYVPEEGTLSGVPFLAKPYRPADLMDVVNAAIESRPA